MIEHMLNPVLLDLPGGLQIRYYGLVYLVGLAIGYFIIKKLVQEKNIKLSKEEVLDYIIYLGIGLLVGGRLLYFLFYMPWVFWQEPLQVLMIWNGGMSFHGGLIGAFVAGYIFCRKKNVSLYNMADITVIPAALGLALGRIGNFINGELPGRLWDGSFCINYENNPYLQNPPEGCRYPSQIVESIKNLVIFTSLWFLKDRGLAKGSVFWLFVLFYGILRFLVEFIRQPDPQLGFFFGWVTMGQILSTLMILIGGFMVYKRNYRQNIRNYFK